MRWQVAMRRKGNVYIYAVVAMPVLLGVASLAAELGRVQLARSELQAAVDAAARHGASGIADGTAVTRAISAAQDNQYDGGKTVTITASDVELGRWHTPSRTFTGAGTPNNAIRVSASRPVPLLFMKVLGASSANIKATSTAVQISQQGSGFIGLDWLEMNSGGTTDSYNSDLGAYSPSTAGTLGSLASNGRIYLNSSTVKRNLYMRPGQTLSGSSSSYGSRINMSTAMSVPTPSASPYSLLNNDNSRIIPVGVISAGVFLSEKTTVTIPEGNYYFLDFTTNATTLNVTGRATIYVNGNVSFNSTTLNVQSGLPSDFTLIVVKPTGATISFNSFIGLCADIIAPTASVELNSTTSVYGRIIGKTLKINSSCELHYDTALPPIPGAVLPQNSGISPARLVG